MVKFVELENGFFRLTVEITGFKYEGIFKQAEISVEDATKLLMKENGLYINHPDNLSDFQK